MESLSDKFKRSDQVDRRIRATMRALPRFVPPPDLTIRLRVAASKARLEAASGAYLWLRWRDRIQLAFANLMRPVALPVVGGLCSAVFLFSALVPAFLPAMATSQAPTPGDPPTMLTTEPMVKYMAPVVFEQPDAVVDLTIDNQGRLANYTFVGATGPANEQVRRSIENSLPFIEFWPATAFGKPIPGTIRISFRSSHIEVRG